METLLQIDFAIYDIFVPVPTRLHNDLPEHVKGSVYWNPDEQCSHPAYKGDQILVEFINDTWFVLNKREGGWRSWPIMRFKLGVAGMG